MIKYRNMDITTVETGIVAHGVNCQKVMGSGVAKAIREKWPEAYRQYITHPSVLGEVCWAKIETGLWVANCHTQVNYGRDGKRYADPEAIRYSLSQVLAWADQKELPVYMPKIGCGLGGLSWNDDVWPILHKLVDKYKNRVIVCEIGTQ
jgi:O-acetyl-ADP-ribose deacetylase (regulator of RNase III)